MPTLTITELSQRTGLASSALRFYERKGLLRPAGRHGGKRVYDGSAVSQVALIDLLKIAGFTLAEIADMTRSDGTIVPEWRDHARAKQVDLEARKQEIERARAMLQHYIDCPADRLEHCPVHSAFLARHARRLAQT